MWTNIGSGGADDPEYLNKDDLNHEKAGKKAKDLPNTGSKFAIYKLIIFLAYAEIGLENAEIGHEIATMEPSASIVSNMFITYC